METFKQIHQIQAENLLTEMPIYQYNLVAVPLVSVYADTPNRRLSPIIPSHPDAGNAR